MTTPLPIPPSSSRPQSFAAESDAFLGALPTFQTEMGALGAQAEADAAASEAAKNLAVPAAETAATKAAEAAASALSALNAPGTTATSTTSAAIPTSLPATFSLTIQASKTLVVGQYLRAAVTASPANWVEGEIASYNSATGALVLTARHAQGVGTYAAWTVSVAAPRLTTVTNSIVSKAAGFTAYGPDIGTMFDCSGTFTIALDAAATLGDGWYIYVTNADTGTITIDPAGAEQIHGANTIQLMPGDTFLVACNGVGWKANRLGGSQMVVLTSGTSWTPPYDCIAEVMVMGGGGGGSSNGEGAGNGGQHGAMAIRGSLPLKRATSYTYAVGAGGSPGMSGTQPGTTGGTTSFSGPGITAMSAPGGAPGGTTSSATPGSIATGGAINGGAINPFYGISSWRPISGGRSILAGAHGDGGNGGQATGGAGTAGLPGVIIIKF